MSDGNINLFQIGAEGVNVVTAPTHLHPAEMTSAQNAEYVSVSGEGGLDQRPGMSRINATPLGSVVSVHDLATTNIVDLTPHLYAGIYTGGTNNWRTSTDGVTWTGVNLPAKPFSDNTNIEAYFKDIPKAVAIPPRLYFVDGAQAPAVHAWDGVSDHLISTVPPAVSGANILTPTAPFVASETENPASNSTTYSYVLVAKQGSNHSAASAVGTTTTGAAALATLDYNAISNVGVPAGTTSFDVYRTVGGATQGLIGNIPVVGGVATTGNGSGLTGISGPYLDQPVATSIISETENGAGGTTYTYKVVAKDSVSGYHSIASTTYTTTTGASVLSAEDYNALNFTGHSPVANATSYDVYRTVGGATQGKIGSITITGGAFTRGNGSGSTGVTFPGIIAPSAVPNNNASTPVTYILVGKDVGGTFHSAASSASVSVNTAIPLNAAPNYVTVSASVSQTQMPSGGFDVYRTLNGVNQGKIGNISANNYTFIDTGQAGDSATPPAAASGLDTGYYPDGVGNPVFSDGGLAGDSSSAPTTGTGLKAGSANVFSDGGLTGDGSTAPNSAAGATSANPLGVIDMITDGTNLYLAVLDQNNADPVVYGRLLQFNPISESWNQIGASFPTASGSGSPSCLTFYGGALNYGTYNGTASGNTAYATTTNSPLPAGGIIEVHTFATSLAPVCMAEFLGDIYVGTTSLVAATAALVVKRLPVATWSTSLTAGATAALNAYTSLYVFMGRLYAGWTSGGGATAANIYSTPDGITWTLEKTLATTDVPGQMVSFGGNLYVVCAKTGVGYNTTSSIYQRTPGGVWTQVDAPSDSLAGCIGVAYF